MENLGENLMVVYGFLSVAILLVLLVGGRVLVDVLRRKRIGGKGRFRS